MEFIDNQDCLDLLEGSPVNPNLAVFPLIDEACRMPRATYQVWLTIRCPQSRIFLIVYLTDWVVEPVVTYQTSCPESRYMWCATKASGWELCSNKSQMSHYW